MAEFLIKLADSQEINPRTDWRQGDIFSIKHDGFAWGKGECPPVFDIIKVPGANISSCAFLQGPWIQSAGSAPYRMSLWKWNSTEQCFECKSDGLKKLPSDLI